jgi:hypothetical protein
MQDKLVTLHWNALDLLYMAGLCTMWLHVFCSYKIAKPSHIRVGKRRHGIYLVRDASMQSDAGLKSPLGLF